MRHPHNQIKKINFLGLGEHQCKKGFLEIESTQSGFDVLYTSDGKTHNPLEGSAYSVEYRRDGFTNNIFKTVLSLHFVNDKNEQVKIIKFMNMMIATACEIKLNPKLSLTQRIKKCFNVA
jgi:hypothetical protein